MNSAFEFCSSQLGHTLKLKEEEEDDVAEDALCIACEKRVAGFPTYVCIVSHDDRDCRDFYLHKSCAELLFLVDYHDHPLGFKKEEDVVVAEDATCYVCNAPILAGSLTYTCINDDNTDCRSFYLHKSCAQLPSHINHHKHNQHSLALLPALKHICDVCYHAVKFAYKCEDCVFDVCVFCAFEQRVLSHPGHQEHTLTLMKRESLFKCDACYQEAKDSSYVCTTCDFWIHKGCALSPSTIPAPTYHHHPLHLIYSIPDMHRYFQRYCRICGKRAHTNCWVYYCHKCTYFVHIKCSTSSVNIVNETEADNEPDLVQFPLPSEESLFDLIITQYDKFQVDFQGEGENNTSILGVPNNPHVIEKHWSHPDHQLQQVHFSISENVNDDDASDIDPVVLICDGCIQPITVCHPFYYSCFECGFFLHSFCATKLPLKLPAGASPFHPQHLLLLQRRHTVFSLVRCGACTHLTNGFFYHCETCDIKVDVRCAFLPARVKHIAHKQHSLVQRPRVSEYKCRATEIRIDGGMVYGCETCSDFHISMYCAFLPSMIKHRFDTDHLITLRLPPFFYEGVFYCEICEEQVNNQWALYHRDESDHSFHYTCLEMLSNIKFGGAIELDIDDQPHTFTFVYKRPLRKGFYYWCQQCNYSSDYGPFFECYGCGYLLCRKCVRDVA